MKVKNLKSDLDKWSKQNEDLVNHPPHYNKGKYEAIEVIDDAIDEAPTAQLAYAHGNTIKYTLRLWYKDKALEDAKKARWYLNKIIENIKDTD